MVEPSATNTIESGIIGSLSLPWWVVVVQRFIERLEYVGGDVVLARLALDRCGAPVERSVEVFDIYVEFLEWWEAWRTIDAESEEARAFNAAFSGTSYHDAYSDRLMH